jgi:RNA polymerase sigma-70 factor, ECF subfamily
VTLTNAQTDDGGLWKQWRAGDSLAFEVLVRRHTPRLLAVATRLVRDGSEADEVVQEVFIAAWRGASGFDGRSQLGTWLHRITINAALGRLRRGQKRREVSMEHAFAGNDDETLADPPDHGAIEAEVQNEIATTVWNAIESLDHEQRTVLVLRDIEELSSKEVSLALGISDASVRQRLHRARQTVAERLRPELRGAEAITCGGRLDLMFDYLDGSLQADLIQPVSVHVAECGTCITLASGYEAISAEIRLALPLLPARRSAALAASIVSAVRVLIP